MKAATGELQLTVITIIAIAAIIAFFWIFWPKIQDAINGEWGFINDNKSNHGVPEAGLVIPGAIK